MSRIARALRTVRPRRYGNALFDLLHEVFLRAFSDAMGGVRFEGRMMFAEGRVGFSHDIRVRESDSVIAQKSPVAIVSLRSGVSAQRKEEIARAVERASDETGIPVLADGPTTWRGALAGWGALPRTYNAYWVYAPNMTSSERKRLYRNWARAWRLPFLSPDAPFETEMVETLARHHFANIPEAYREALGGMLLSAYENADTETYRQAHELAATLAEP